MKFPEDMLLVTGFPWLCVICIALVKTIKDRRNTLNIRAEKFINQIGFSLLATVMSYISEEVLASIIWGLSFIILIIIVLILEKRRRKIMSAFR